MSHATTDLVVQPTNAFYAAGAAGILNVAKLITADAAATVEAANYLNASASRLPKGTIINAVMAASGTPVLKDYVVTANTGTVVTIALATATAG